LLKGKNDNQELERVLQAPIPQHKHSVVDLTMS